jgi:MFS family permease
MKLSDPARVLWARGLRAFGDGFVAILLPVHLSLLGFEPLAIGAISTATLLGSALLTLALGLSAHRVKRRRALLGACILMAATGLGFVLFEGFWPLLVIAFVGTLNPSSGDVSVFLPLEHTVLAQSAATGDRTALFARYSFVGSVVAALGAMASGAVEWLNPWLDQRTAIDTFFAIYGVLGLVSFTLYLRLAPSAEAGDAKPGRLIGASRRRVYGLASLLALWLFERFGLSVAETGTIFFVTGLCSSASFFAAVPLAQRFGLLNTMVFTHLPANVLLVLTAFAPTALVAFILLICRSLLSQMDVPTRSAYVMAIVTPEERPAAASMTAVPRSLASALAPLLSGWLLGLGPFGWPLVIAGCLKISYDLILLRQFRSVEPSGQV